MSNRELNSIDALATLTADRMHLPSAHVSCTPMPGDAMAAEFATVLEEHRKCKKLATDLYNAQLDRDSARVEVDTLRFNAEQDKKQKAENLALITKLTEQRDKAANDLKDAIAAAGSNAGLFNTERKKHEETRAMLVGEKAQKDTLSEVSLLAPLTRSDLASPE